MEAIYTRGPMTVSVNAEGEDWRFYRSGVYNNTACSPKLKRLDHAVVVSGCVRPLPYTNMLGSVLLLLPLMPHRAHRRPAQLALDCPLDTSCQSLERALACLTFRLAMHVAAECMHGGPACRQDIFCRDPDTLSQCTAGTGRRHRERSTGS